MSKSLKDLFAKPPPTTYEIEANNLKPPSYVEQPSSKSGSNSTLPNSSIDPPQASQPTTNNEANVVAMEGVQQTSTNKRKERVDSEKVEPPHKKIVIADAVVGSPQVETKSFTSSEVSPKSQNSADRDLQSESTPKTIDDTTTQQGGNNIPASDTFAYTPQTTQADKQTIENTTAEPPSKAISTVQPVSQEKSKAPFVSPLDIILGAVNVERLNAIQERASLPVNPVEPAFTTPPPHTQPALPTETSPSEAGLLKKKPGLRTRKKQGKKKKAANASFTHADRPYDQERFRDMDENDMFSEFEALKARTEKTTAATSQKQQAKTNNNQAKQNKQQKQQANGSQNQRSKSVSNDALPDFHLPNGKQSKPANKTPFVPRKVCVYFLKGSCNSGDKCTFKHERPADLPPPPPPATSKIVCQFFKTGACAQFENCKFSHDLKIEPCRFFHMSGTCEQGDRCMYSHEPLNDDRLKRLRTLTGPCRFYHFKGYCNNPDTCLFSHDEATEDQLKEVESTIKPCRFYHVFKNCAKGDDCFYAHDEANPLQVQQLLQEEKKKK